MTRTSGDPQAQEKGWQRKEQTGLVDAFEPNLLVASLKRKHSNLGHLIFGDSHWAKTFEQAGHTGQPLTLFTASDPLSRHFASDIRLARPSAKISSSSVVHDRGSK